MAVFALMHRDGSVVTMVVSEGERFAKAQVWHLRQRAWGPFVGVAEWCGAGGAPDLPAQKLTADEAQVMAADMGIVWPPG